MSDEPLKFGEAGPEIQRLREENQHLRGVKDDIREEWAELIKDNAAKAAEITRLRAELATARCNDMGDAWIAQKHSWQEAIEDALLQWCSAPSDDEEPKAALRRLIQYEITAALDPAVSQAAADLVATARRDALAEIKQDTDELIEQGRQDGMEQAAQRLEELHKNHGYNPQTGEVWRLGKLVTCPLTIDHAIGYYRAIAEGGAHIRAAAGEVKP